jgi:hypothetical protein
MVYSHTPNTELSFQQIENALKGATQDDLPNLVKEIKELYAKALLIQELSNEFNSGSYDF